MSKLALLLIGLSMGAQAEVLYESSFESVSKDWSLDKGGALHRGFAKTGKQSLHLKGGESEVVLSLSGKARRAKGIVFDAERWSSKAPFEFRVDVKQDGKWKELTVLDQLVVTGARLRSNVKLAIPEGGEVSEVRLRAKTAEKTGVLVDDLKLLSDAPKHPSVAPKAFVKPSEPLELLEHNDVFVSGEDKTNTYRIPALITAKNGDLLAVIDARRSNGADLIHQRSIDIMLKRSKDNGKTWGPMETIADLPDGEGASDASLILNRDNGEIFCFYNWMGKSKEFRFYMQSSKDNGESWSAPRDFTDEVVPKEWNTLDFKFITSGRGIQTRDGELMHNFVHLPTGTVYLFGSKDGGKSWKRYPHGVKPADESKVVELADGSLMVNSRVGADYRWVHRSDDHGQTWHTEKEFELPDPRCNGSIIRYTSKADGYAKDRLLFSNAGSQKARENLTIRISYDEGKTWSAGKVVNPGNSAYSSLTILKNGDIGVFYENGYTHMKFARFTLEALTDGKDKLEKPYETK